MTNEDIEIEELSTEAASNPEEKSIGQTEVDEKIEANATEESITIETSP